MISDFDVDKCTQSIASLKEWICKTFQEYRIKIFHNEIFAIDPQMYVTPIVEYFLNNFCDQIKFKNTIIDLMNHRGSHIRKFSSAYDFIVFNKFSDKMYTLNQNMYNANNNDKNNALSFNFDKMDILDMCVFVNMLFSVTDYASEGDELIENFYLKNIFLQKFLKCAIEQIDIEKKVMSNFDSHNPIKRLYNFI